MTSQTKGKDRQYDIIRRVVNVNKSINSNRGPMTKYLVQKFFCYEKKSSQKPLFPYFLFSTFLGIIRVIDWSSDRGYIHQLFRWIAGCGSSYQVLNFSNLEV